MLVYKLFQRRILEVRDADAGRLLTMRVENTKSSSYKPQCGRPDISPITAAATPITCKTQANIPHRYIEIVESPI